MTIDALRPWVGLALGLLLVARGAMWIRKPQAFLGGGMIPATNPRTVRAFGVFVFIVGLLNAGLNLPLILSE